MFVLGINLSHHSSIALIKNNEVLLFLHEERVNGKKYYQGIPYKALDLIKNYTRSIDFISFISGPGKHLEQIIQHLASQGVTCKASRRENEKHHLAHAAAGFYMSDFREAAIVVIDGAGALWPFGDNLRASETTSIYRASFPRINCISKKFVVGLYDKQPIHFTNSDQANFKKLFEKSHPVVITKEHDIGWKYATVTSKIGFGVFGEGKTMGLSAYGHSDSKDGNAISAYKIQKELEKHFVTLIGRLNDTNIVLSGGCALNILGNSHIKRTFPNLNIFVDPIAADGTVAIGAAAHYYYSVTNDSNKLLFDAYRGPSYNIEKNYIYECARKYSI